MSRFLFLVLLTVTLTACQSTQPEPPLAVLASGAASGANRAIVQAAYASFARGDIEAFLAILDPDVEWTDAEGFPYAGTYVGPDDLLNGLLVRIGAEWDGWSAVPTAYIADGDRVVALGNCGGTYKATGRSVEAPFAHVWELAEGKVVRFRQFTDAPPWERATTP